MNSVTTFLQSTDPLGVAAPNGYKSWSDSVLPFYENHQILFAVIASLYLPLVFQLKDIMESLYPGNPRENKELQKLDKNLLFSDALKLAKTDLTPSLFKQYGKVAGLGLGALYLAGGFDVKEEDEIDQKTGQDLIDANPDDYLIANLDPYVGAPGPVGVATDFPLYAANGGAMGDVFPRRTGGIMPDEGIPNKDSVKAMVMPGEFILTTDAVRGAGGGDLNRGINNMYSVMRNLESVGRRAS